VRALCFVVDKATIAAPRHRSRKQGDQIGRIFAYWVTVYFGTFLQITQIAQNVGLLISKAKVYVLFLFRKTG
jgi:hypothetical protein